MLPQLWKGAVVVMDNLPAHKVIEIEPLIQSVGASVLYQSPYSPDFNPIEHWWSQLKAFLSLHGLQEQELFQIWQTHTKLQSKIVDVIAFA